MLFAIEFSDTFIRVVCLYIIGIVLAIRLLKKWFGVLDADGTIKEKAKAKAKSKILKWFE